jgi:hypothetical protein
MIVDAFRHALIPPASSRLRHVDPGEEERKVGTAHLDRARRRIRRPRKRALLEALIENPKPGSIPRKDLEAVAATIPKQKQMAGQRVQREALTDERRQAINGPS